MAYDTCSHHPLIGAVLAPRCIDAEELFSRLALALQKRGVRLGGVQQINVHREDRRRCDMRLKDLATGEEIAISEDRGAEARGCRLDHGALGEAAERVARSIREGVDLVIINKFGKAESEGGGMRDVIALALEHEIPVLTCANAEHHANLLAFTGDLAVTLTLSGPDIETWLDAVLLARRADAVADWGPNMQTIPVKCECGHDHEPLLPIAEACHRAAARVTAIAKIECVGLRYAAGRILAEDVSARLAMPRFDQSAMDGYALAADAVRSGVVVLPVSGRILAGDAAAPLVPASAVRIFTGAPLPEGADTVVMQENASQRGSQVVIRGPLSAGSHIRRRGEDIAEGELLLRRGARIDARRIGLLAAQGIAEIVVWRRPVVAVISTGNELRQAGEDLSEGAIYDSNRPMLRALAHAAGFEVIDGGGRPDNGSLLTQRLQELSAQADLIVSSAGASVGDEDNSYKAAVSAGGEVEALRIAMKPGKPAVVGRLGRAAYLGLPGNPVSTFVSWCFLGGAMAAALQGRDWQPPAGVPLPSASHFAHKPGRTEFVPARLVHKNGRLSIEILGHGASAHLKPVAMADGLVEIAETEGGVEPGGLYCFTPFAVCV